MLDPADDSPLSLNHAAHLLAPLCAGKPVHPSTVYRWATQGPRGVVLATTRVGARRFTSRAALRRFLDAVAALGAAAPPG